ncbi:MAG: CBS domain-containing protein [Blautia sp.]|nr:CBS domain-containing protein [Blautia sp.]
MNILFFLTPKEDVAYIYDTYSLRQVLEKMEYHKYSCIPIITERGKYAGTITEGDLLWGLKNRGQLDLKKAEEVPIVSFKRRNDYAPIRVDSNMENLLEKAMQQNFVPVVDDQKNFIGIVTRRDIMQYICSLNKKESNQA